LLEKEITQKILDSEELDNFIVKYEKGVQDDEKATRDLSRSFVAEFRLFLEEQKLVVETRRIDALHETLAARLQSANSGRIVKLLDPKSDSDMKETPYWCQRFVDETFDELDGKMTLRPIKWPDANRVWGIIKQRHRKDVAKKRR